MNETHFFRFATVIVAGKQTKSKSDQMVNTVIGGVKMTRNWFIGVVFTNIINMITDTVT